ncbi:MAG TPA: hypothetical protein VF868_15805 [Bacteroidia bacterium]|jgi:hypothetical protein
MDYIERLEKEHSRFNTDCIAKVVGNDPAEFKKIVEIIYSAKAPLPQRASWLLAVVSQKYPELITPFVPKFINTITGFNVDGIKRNMLNALVTQKIPRKLQGKTVTICFDFIMSPSETVAVKVLSLEILSHLAKEYPELKEEIKAVIEDQLPKTTIAFRARAKKVLKKIT